MLSFDNNYLFPGTESTNHTIRINHLVIFLFIMADITGIGLSTAWKPTFERKESFDGRHTEYTVPWLKLLI